MLPNFDSIWILKRRRLRRFEERRSNKNTMSSNMGSDDRNQKPFAKPIRTYHDIHVVAYC